MTIHLVCDSSGTPLSPIKLIDISKGVTLDALRDVHGLTVGVSYRLRATSSISPILTIPAISVAPANTVLPTISGTAQEGQTLTATAGTWTGTAPITYAYQWQRGLVDIPGATATTYAAVFDDVGTTLRVVVTASNAGGVVAANSAATAVVSAAAVGPYALPIEPYIRWSAKDSVVTTVSGRIATATDLQGVADLATTPAALGPIAHVDGAGQPCWRFPKNEALTAIAGVQDRKNSTVLMVMRNYISQDRGSLFALGTVESGIVREVMMAGFSGHARSLIGGNFVPDGSPTKPISPNMMLGCQVQVAGITSRGAGDGGFTTTINDNTFRTLRGALSGAGIVGAILGGGPRVEADIYEVVCYDRALTDVEVVTVSTAMMAAYNISSVVNQIGLEGASIASGRNAAPEFSAAMVLSEPGTGLLPAGWRIFNAASGGSTVADIVSRFAKAEQWGAYNLPGGRNLITMEVGVNDIGGGTTGAQHYTNIVNLINTATTGLLQRGWEVCVLGNVGNGGTTETQLQIYRDLLELPQFLIDTDSAPGGTYAGKVSSIMLNKVQIGGVLVLDTANTVAPYYDTDAVHLLAPGQAARATGGDTPQFGIGHLFA